jgi:cell division protein ZapA
MRHEAVHACTVSSERCREACFFQPAPHGSQTRCDNLVAMNAVKVQIFGQIYTIRGELDERYVQKLAAYVDEKMSAIADGTATIDTQKAAVLAALAIADELHTTRKDRTEEEELLREQAERCLTLVERALKQTA